VAGCERRALPALAPFVASLGYFEGELAPGRERVLPSAQVSLMVNLYEDEFRTYHGADHSTVRRTRGAAFSGPQARHTVIDTAEQRSLVYVNFRLGGAAPFLDAPLDATRDELVDLEELWGRDGPLLRERVLEAPTAEGMLRVLEAALLARLRRADGLDASIGFAVRALEGGATVSTVTSRLDVLPKQFVRRFRSHIGLTPKRFARVRRLQRLLGAVARDPEPEWAEAAAEHGYYDQSHLIHDFRELAGFTPTAYRPRAAHEWNHVPVG
jgi:AraC-like DNA-binding protein